MILGETDVAVNFPPLISVIIPHLNQPENLRLCLRALVEQQDGTDTVEIIVVDNGSEYLPTAIVDDFEGIVLETEMTAGPGPARNRGVDVSNGEILAFIDADCIADVQWLLTIAATFKNSGPGTIFGGDVRIAVADSAGLTILEAYESVYAYRQEEYISLQGFSGTGNLAVRRADFFSIGPFAGINQAEDRDWGHRAKRLGHNIQYVPEMIVYHPARKSFSELFRKWDRHISHDLEDWPRGYMAHVRWALRAIAIAISPLTEIGRILSSRRLNGIRPRIRALTGLVFIRLYRSQRMLKTLLQKSNLDPLNWNRS